MAVHGAAAGDVVVRDRPRALHRPRPHASRAPAAMTERGARPAATGSVLDPIVAIRCRRRARAGRDGDARHRHRASPRRARRALALVEKYQRPPPRRPRVRAGLDPQPGRAAPAQRHARPMRSSTSGWPARVLYANAALRADAGVLAAQPPRPVGLWGYGISGDLPIVLVQIGDAANIELVRQLVQAHAYWRLKGLAVDLVIWNEDHVGYRQVLQDQIMGLIAAGAEAHAIDRPGGIFVRRGEQMSEEDRVLLQTVARVDRRRQPRARSPSRSSAARPRRRVPVARLQPTRAASRPSPPAPRRSRRAPDLAASTAWRLHAATAASTSSRTAPARDDARAVGQRARESRLRHRRLAKAAAPTPGARTRTSSGSRRGTTIRSRDASGEAFYLRDEESGRVLVADAAARARRDAVHRRRHGFGYSVFEHTEDGIAVRACDLRRRRCAGEVLGAQAAQRSGRARRLSVTGYVEWVLGDLRAKTAPHVVTEIDADDAARCSRAIATTASSPAGSRSSTSTTPSRTVTGDRTEFLGRNGTLREPGGAGAQRACPAGSAPALDPCARAAGAVRAGRRPGARDRLPARRRAATSSDARELRPALPRHRRGAQRARRRAALLEAHARRGARDDARPGAQRAGQRLARSTRRWRAAFWGAQRLLPVGRRVRLPRPAAGRDGARRTPSRGSLREHLLRVRGAAVPRRRRAALVASAARAAACARTAPTTTSGCRSPPAATSQTTGDAACSTRRCTSSRAARSSPDEEAYYDLPRRSDEAATLYEHCVRAIQHGLRFGEHGLPLMGCGDWNDGMNLVGNHGKGESVWLGVLPVRRADVVRRRSRERRDDQRVRRALPAPRRSDCGATSSQHAWDGAWYRRAYFDDGTPLGSGDERRVPDRFDRAELVGAVGRRRHARARAWRWTPLDERLVRRDAGLIQLLDPPFDKSELNPGYIKGYVPGVRENGGQYTHAAIWAAMAFAALGDSRRAWELSALINPINHARTRRGGRRLQGRALRRRRRRLRRPAAHRPRRLDLVHGLGRLDVPPDRGVAAGPAAARRQAAHRPVHAGRLGNLRPALSLRRDALSHQGPARAFRDRDPRESA